MPPNQSLLFWFLLTMDAAICLSLLRPTLEPGEQQISDLVRDFKCHSVYLDVGSNIGVQIRKLYEPQAYNRVDPELIRLSQTIFKQHADLKEVAKHTPQVLPIYDEYFGSAPRCNVCAIGIEPNPRHASRLESMQQALRAAGAGVLVLTSTAADVEDGNTSLLLSRSSFPWGPKVNDVGMAPLPASVPLPKSLRHSSRLRIVKTVDLARLLLFIRRTLGHTRSGGSKLVMKVDTEGAEYRLLPHLIKRGAACTVDFMFLEWHLTTKAAHIAAKRSVTEALSAPACKVVVSSLDDETFLFDGVPFPNRSVCGDLRPAGRPN